MSYDVVTPTDVQSIPRTFQIIQADFAKIGVQLRQKALDSTAAFDLMSGPNGTYQGFDLAMWDWTALVDPDFMLSVVTCGQYGGWSDSGFCDKRYDAMYSQQQLTPNQAKRRAVVWRMQAYLAQQRPYLWLANERLGQRRRAELDRLHEHAAGAVQRAVDRQPDDGAPEVGVTALITR